MLRDRGAKARRELLELAHCLDCCALFGVCVCLCVCVFVCVCACVLSLFVCVCPLLPTRMQEPKALCFCDPRRIHILDIGHISAGLLSEENASSPGIWSFFRRFDRPRVRGNSDSASMPLEA